MMKRRRFGLMVATSLCPVLLSMVGCGGPEPSTDLEGSSDPLYGGGTLSTLWTRTIPVCFAQTGFATQRANTRDIFQDTWPRVAPIFTSGWDTCATSNPGGTIRVTYQNDSNGSTTLPLGFNASSAENVTLIGNDGGAHFRYEVIHEFGHALGFVHDQERPDNWDSNGNPIYCSQIQAGVTSRTGGIYYTGPDNISVMSYCSTDPGGGFPTRLSAADVLGLRASYGSNNSNSCQKLSDIYGISAGTTFGFAPSGVRTNWTASGCSAYPSSGDTCQKASDLYGITAGVTFGFAPSDVQTWWINSGCQTVPRSSIGLCQRASETFGIVAYFTFGNAPSSVQTWWINNNCQTTPRPQDACQKLSDNYGIVAGSSFGWAPTSVQTWWTAHACNTTPVVSNQCQLLSDLFGESTSTTAAAPQDARTFWTNNSCATSPASSNACQKAADAFAIVAGVTWGFAPSEVRTWWTNSGCNARPTFLDTCQTMSDRYGIVAGLTFGAAPADVQTWWTASGCNSTPKDAIPIPG